uniref:Small ribosomal subunit protein mS40 n=1 Tax=Chelonoidis abingdonii TaxID=106734 RepID=A0A8C0IM87_CHEAB
LISNHLKRNQHTLWALFPSCLVSYTRVALLLRLQRPLLWMFSTEMDPAAGAEPVAFATESCFKKKPWEYLEMEEYIERYGTHPPQKTRKTCIRGKKIAGNPCLICRDQKLHVDYRNLKLLEQFICSHMCVIFHPTRTGVCMKQHKRLTQTINQARDHGLLSFHIPLVTLQGKDYTNQYQAVTKMPPTPSMQSQTPWYLWYEPSASPDELALVPAPAGIALKLPSSRP